MKKNIFAIIGFSSLIILSGCATTPMGPTVNVMPRYGENYLDFLQAQNFCKEQARQQVYGQAEHDNHRAIGTTLIGTAVGAALGAAVGGGGGAAIGAAGGTVVGGGFGAHNSSQYQGNVQFQYNSVYQQCMFARPNRVVHHLF